MRLLSLPSFAGECASELEIIVYPSSIATLRFIRGSDDSPVSFYDLNGKLIKSNSTICSSLSAGVYVVKVGVNAVKVMVP